MIETKRKPGRPKESLKPRKQLSASVAGESDEQLYLWLAEFLKINDKSHVGRVIDMLVKFGKTYQFHKTIVRPKKQNEPHSA